MKITRIEIDGFGCLSEFRVDVAPALHVFDGPNEAGKSTLQRALLAGLYGFYEADRATKFEGAERERFIPWQGSPYRVRIEYALQDGRRYRVDRDFFTSDVITTIIDLVTGVDVTDEFGRGRHGNVPFARKHLGMPRRVFEACACVSQGALLELGGADNFPQQLGETIVNLADTGRPDRSAQTALDRLDKAHKEQVGGPRARAAPLPAALKRKRALSDELERIQAIHDGIEQAARELEEISAKTSRARATTQRLAYLLLCRRIDNLRDAIDQVEALEKQAEEKSGTERGLKAFATFPVEQRDVILQRWSALVSTREAIGVEVAAMEKLAEDISELDRDAERAKDGLPGLELARDQSRYLVARSELRAAEERLAEIRRLTQRDLDGEAELRRLAAYAQFPATRRDEIVGRMAAIRTSDELLGRQSREIVEQRSEAERIATQISELVESKRRFEGVGEVVVDDESKIEQAHGAWRDARVLAEGAEERLRNASLDAGVKDEFDRLSAEVADLTEQDLQALSQRLTARPPWIIVRAAKSAVAALRAAGAWTVRQAARAAGWCYRTLTRSASLPEAAVIEVPPAKRESIRRLRPDAANAILQSQRRYLELVPIVDRHREAEESRQAAAEALASAESSLRNVLTRAGIHDVDDEESGYRTFRSAIEDRREIRRLEDDLSRCESERGSILSVIETYESAYGALSAKQAELASDIRHAGPGIEAGAPLERMVEQFKEGCEKRELRDGAVERHARVREELRSLLSGGSLADLEADVARLTTGLRARELAHPEFARLPDGDQRDTQARLKLDEAAFNDRTLSIRDLQRTSTTKRENLKTREELDEERGLSALESALRRQLRAATSTDGSLEELLTEFERRNEGRQTHDLAAQQRRQTEEKIGLLLGGKSLPDLLHQLQADTDERDQLMSRNAQLAGAKSGQAAAELTRALQDAEQLSVELALEEQRLSTTITSKLQDLPERAQVEEDLARCEADIHALEQYGAALELASKTIESAMVEAHRDFAPSVGRFLTQGFDRATDGRYQKAFLDPSTLRVSAEVPETHSVQHVDQLSRGTQSIAYLLLRTGLAQHMSDIHEPVPLFLDDPLVDLDEVRASKVLAMLAELSAATQILVFTKDTAIGSWFESNGGDGLHSVVSHLPGPRAASL